MTLNPVTISHGSARLGCSAFQTFIAGDFAAAADGGTAPSHGFDGSRRHATASDIDLRMIEWT